MTKAIRGRELPTWAAGYPVGNGLRFSIVVAPEVGRRITAEARAEGISTAEKIRRLLDAALE